MQLKQLRKSRKLTQADVAHFLGIPQKTYQNYEREVRDPDSDVLCKLADLYGVSLDTLFNRQHEAVASVSIDARVVEICSKLSQAGIDKFVEYGELLVASNSFTPEQSDLDEHMD